MRIAVGRGGWQRVVATTDAVIMAWVVADQLVARDGGAGGGTNVVGGAVLVVEYAVAEVQRYSNRC